MTSQFEYGYKIFDLSENRYWIQGFISAKFKSILRKIILLNIPQQKLVLKYNVNENTENKVQHSKSITYQKLHNLHLTPPMIYLTLKLFPKQKILDKPLLNRRNKNRKLKNLKDGITTKIKVGAICLLAKTALLPTVLSKNNTAPAKCAIDLHKSSKDTILFLAQKKSG